MRLRSERLELTPLRAEDAAELLAIRRDPSVARFQGWTPASLAEAKEFIARQAEAIFDNPETWFQLAIRPLDGDSLLGDLGIHFLEEGSRQVEIGFTLSPTEQGRGLAAEAVSALLDHLFGPLDKHRVIASVDPQNDRAIALLTRLRFRKEAHFVKSLLDDGEWVDDVRFGLLAEEWQK